MFSFLFDIDFVGFVVPGEVLKKVKMATYKINIKRILKKEGAVVGLADGTLFSDDKAIYEAKN